MFVIIIINIYFYILQKYVANKNADNDWKKELKAECCKNYSGYSVGMEINIYTNIICLIMYNHLI